MSYSRRDPVIRPTPILELRPTQMTVGMLEVERKRKAWRAKGGAAQAKAIEQHMVPVVLGPDGGRFITDHHHLARALHDDGETQVFVTVIGDLRKADREHFWNLMDCHGWTHPFDGKGRRCDYDDLPKTVADLQDDPYRALSGALRNAGGYAKDSTPYSEFVWADYFRTRIKAKDLKHNFEAELEAALKQAKSGATDYLPGWCGPHASNEEEPTASAKKKRAPRK